jgi:hypothetical protein
MISEAKLNSRFKALLILGGSMVVLTACALEMSRQEASESSAQEKAGVDARFFTGRPECKNTGCPADTPLMAGTRELLVLSGDLSNLSQKRGALVTTNPEVLTVLALSPALHQDFNLPEDAHAYEVQAHRAGSASLSFLHTNGKRALEITLVVQSADELVIRHLGQKDEEGTVHLNQEGRLSFLVEARADKRPLLASAGFSLALSPTHVAGLLVSETGIKHIQAFVQTRQIGMPRTEVDAGWAAASLVAKKPGRTHLVVNAPGGARAEMAIRVDGTENSL